jgi:ketosteroid isomerase-like protein
MKKIIALVWLLAVCGCKEVDGSKQACNEIRKADSAMNVLAGATGFHAALLQYADEDVIKPNDGDLPIIGKKNLELNWNKKPDTKQISWQPVRVEACSGGDFGYTFGNWKFILKDTTLYGNYCTVWKKQKNGTWKFVFDGGNGTPKPLTN